jgi:hypothetical protein
MSDTKTTGRLRWRKRIKLIEAKRRHKPLVLMLARKWVRRI